MSTETDDEEHAMRDPVRSKSVGLILRMLKPGESATFTRHMPADPVTGLFDPRVASKYQQSIGTYGLRHRPRASWRYESFVTVTHQGRPLVGVVVTLVSIDRDAESALLEAETAGEGEHYKKVGRKRLSTEESP